MSIADGTETTEQPSDRAPAMTPLSRRAALASALALAAPTLYLSFNAGGFFVTESALVAVVLLGALLVHATTAARPFAGIGRGAAIAIAGMALFCVWTLVSSSWSGASARALIEFDRALLYAAALVLFASFAPQAGRMRAMLGGFVIAVAVVAAIALITRVLPDVWPIRPGTEDNRLSYPLTYWNALALLVGAGAIGALHFATSARERVSVRVLATTLLPLFVAVLYFTLSRGSIAVVLAGALLFLAIARPRGALPVLLAALPTSAAVVLAGYDADLLTTESPTTSAAVAQGQRVALVVAGALVVTAVLRLALVGLERRLRAPRVSVPIPSWLAIGGTLAIVAVAVLATGVAQRGVESFADSNEIARQTDERSRLLSLSNNGRFDHWRVARDSFLAEPLHGTGAGTYQNEWARERPSDFTVIHAHSLYAQVLGELGVVGLALLLVPLVAIAVALARRARGPDRAVPAAVLAMTAMWLVHAGIDWDWEMPAVTLWVFALGGVGLASGSQRVAWLRRGTPRLVIGLCVLVLAVNPVLLGLSQRQLDGAARAFDRGDCATAIDRGLASISILSVRPQPYALVGLCDVRLGEDALGVQMLERAVARDPDDWSYHYGLALAQAAAGQDPRAAARRAKQLNPHDPRTAYGLTLYGRGGREQWRRRALAAPLPW